MVNVGIFIRITIKFYKKQKSAFQAVKKSDKNKENNVVKRERCNEYCHLF